MILQYFRVIVVLKMFHVKHFREYYSLCAWNGFIHIVYRL